MEDIYLQWYETFLLVAKYQSYQKASEDLIMSKTAVFNQIKSLEKILHVTLFKRAGRNIILTPAGLQFYYIAQETVNCIENGINIMRSSRSNFTTQIKIAASSYIVSYLIPKFLPIFSKKAPDIDIIISIEDYDLEHKILSNYYDIGIHRKPTTSKQLKSKKICEGSIRLIVPNKRENHYFRTESDYFNKYPVICDNHPVYWKDLKSDIFSVEPNSKCLSVASVNATESMIQANQGVSYLPLYILKNNDLSLIKVFDSVTIAPPISFTYLLWKQENEAIKTFNSLFEEFIKEEQI